jgi:hypothetical protein
MRARVLLLGLLSLASASCVTPPGPAQRATDAARELNFATRFGRMDIALQLTANGAKKSFLERRTEWGRGVRVLDLELAGLSLKSPHDALIQVDVAWTRNEESLLRTTRIAQTWRDEDDGGWQLVREQRIAGDLGLFGEHVDVVYSAPRDVQFPTKTIR